jgi:hypothetical protein
MHEYLSWYQADNQPKKCKLSRSTQENGSLRSQASFREIIALFSVLKENFKALGGAAE